MSPTEYTNAGVTSVTFCNASLTEFWGPGAITPPWSPMTKNEIGLLSVMPS